MNLSKAIHDFRLRRKILREKPHVWEIPAAKACYIQNYKVATRSIRHAIVRHILMERGENLDYDQIPLELVNKFDKEVSSFRSPTEIRKLYPKHFVFSFVRNPLSRLYSCYSNKLIDADKKGIPNRFSHYGITPDDSFERFVHKIADIPDCHADRHFRSQHWFFNSNGTSIADYVGKIESLNDDWQTLTARFGFPPLPHKNKSLNKSPDPRQFYTKETLAITAERYRQDIEQFGYSAAL